MREGLAANRISYAMGILNGTTNHILSAMAHSDCTMQEALRQAQRLGMAEKDPTLDLDGTDTAHKTSILASMMTGTWVRPESVLRRGIAGVCPADIRFAVEKLGRTVRLLGTAAVDWDASPPRVSVHVQPTLVGLKHPLAAVHGGYNAVLLGASAAGDLMFYGLGAGPGPAASAVLGDLLTLGRELLSGRSPSSESSAPGRRLAAAPEPPAQFYLRLGVRDVPGALAAITRVLARAGVSIAQAHQERPSSGTVPVVLVTHATPRERVDRAFASTRALPVVTEGSLLLRMLP